MSSETVSPTAQAEQPEWPEFKLQIDENAGVYNAPRKTPSGPEDGWFFTNNAFVRLFWQPKLLIDKYVGLVPLNFSFWFRTTDSNPDFSKTVMRIFAGPAFYARPVENNTWRLQINESPNFFFGHDLNSPAAKDWKSWEFGNYASLDLLYKPAGLLLDVHNWYVRGLDVKIAAGKSAKEDGVIVGTTLGWTPFSVWKTGLSFLDSLAFYIRYRKWGWLVEQAGANVDRVWWDEVTLGLKGDIPFSIFE